MTTFLQRLSMAVEADFEVSKVAIVNQGKVLVGRRTDNDKWDLPGGHLDAEETAAEALIREVYEETGLRIPPAQYLGSDLVTNKSGDLVLVHAFLYKSPSELLPEETEEMKDWQWTDAKKGNDIFKEKWANPDDVVLKKIGVL